jgi:hypothetical protein
MKPDKIRHNSGTQNHIGNHTVGSDQIPQLDPTTEKKEVPVLCLIVITLKSVVFGIWPLDPSVIPNIGSDRIQHYEFDVIPSPRNESKTIWILSGGWILQDPIESGIGLMDLVNYV